jgi:hypothetical protein
MHAAAKPAIAIPVIFMPTHTVFELALTSWITGGASR